jgi:hypothetical protein
MGHHDDPLMLGMFWGGLLVASVPMLLTLGIAIYVLKQYRESGGDGEGPSRLADTEPRRR